MTARRQSGHDQGSFTAEFAAGLPALMLLLIAGITAISAVTTKGQCVAAAREGALAASRGEPGTEAAVGLAPPESVVDLSADADTVTVVVRSRIRVLGGGLPVITVEATAVAAQEPAVTGVIPQPTPR